MKLLLSIQRRLFFCCAILACSINLFAQYEHVWAFGKGAGLNFNTNPPTALETAINTLEGTASVCDENGNLLFYTDGSNVYDRTHNLMPNGINLTGLTPYGWGYPSVTYSTTQAVVIVPKPGSVSLYYVFSLVSSSGGAMMGDYGKLYFSLVDMNLNNGLGDIVVGEKGVLVDSGFHEAMTVIPGDRCDIWLLVSRNLPPHHNIEAYRITSGGVDLSPIISPGPSIPTFTNNVESLIGSKDYGKVVFMTTEFISFPGVVSIFDFDRLTGQLYNSMQLPVSASYGSFSPDGSKLYVSGGGEILQFDLNAGSMSSIINSKTILGMGFHPLKLGPDDRIYVCKHHANDLDVIQFPNLPGMASQYTPNAVELAPGTHGNIGLPNAVPVANDPDTTYNFQSVSAACFASLTSFSANDTSGWNYLWNDQDTNKTKTVEQPGIYWVSYFTDCLYHVDSFWVQFPGGVLPTIKPLAECRGDRNGSAYATTYPGDPVNYTYTWLRGNDTLSTSDTLSGVSAGPYSLYVSTDTGCDTLLYFDIPEEDFQVSFSASDTLICLGETIQFENRSDDHFMAFYWDLDNGDRYQLGALQDYEYSESGAYRVMLAGTGEICKDTAYQTIVVDQPIVPHFAARPGAICVGQPINLLPHTDSTTAQVQWELAGQRRVEPAVQNHYQHAFDQAGIFTIQLDIQSRACPDTSYTDSIHVYPLPEVDLGDDTSICLHGQPVYLRNLREAPLDPYHQVWSTGDTAAILKVVHPGVYALSVTTDPHGCTTTETIEIKKDCYIDVPNAFTPNGDGHNDYFFPRQLLSESVNRFHMQVFNRWGQVVYETSRLDGRGWDGRLNDQMQPMGVYLYRINVDFANGRQEQYEGNVTLLR